MLRFALVVSLLLPTLALADEAAGDLETPDASAPVLTAAPVLITAPAPAPVVAPSVQAEQPASLLSQLLETLFAVVLLPLLHAAFKALRQVAASKGLEATVDVLEAYVTSAVTKLKTDIDAALADDGKVSKVELDSIIAKLKLELPADALKTLGAHFGRGLETYLTGLIMSAVTDRQKQLADAAGAAAAAKITDVDSAIAARKARLAPVTP